MVRQRFSAVSRARGGTYYTPAPLWRPPLAPVYTVGCIDLHSPGLQPRRALRHDRIILRFAALALRRPTLLGPMVRAAWRFRARRWWAQPPFLPLPPQKYLEWRMHTAFGAGDAIPEPDQLERYLRWTREAARRNPEGH